MASTNSPPIMGSYTRMNREPAFLGTKTDTIQAPVHRVPVETNNGFVLQTRTMDVTVWTHVQKNITDPTCQPPHKPSWSETIDYYYTDPQGDQHLLECSKEGFRIPIRDWIFFPCTPKTAHSCGCVCLCTEWVSRDTGIAPPRTPHIPKRVFCDNHRNECPLYNRVEHNPRHNAGRESNTSLVDLAL